MIGTGLRATPTANESTCPIASAMLSARTTQRKPMWPVDVSTASNWRAAGR